MSEHSSAAEDSEYEPSDLRPDSGLRETQEIRIVKKPPIPIRGGGAASSGVFCGAREVLAPYLQRDDVGSVGVYIGNWSGRRKKQVINDHIAADLIARNAAQIMMAQEVDKQFIQALLDPSSSAEAQSAPARIEGQTSPTIVGKGQGSTYAERPVNLEPWCVALHAAEGDESDASTLVTAARSTFAVSSTAVEWHKMYHNSYKRHGKSHLCYSRMLTAQIEFRNKVHGRSHLQFLNVHFHHMVAKKAFP